ncbi:exodeoxyribonuclease V alpha subunit [Sedimentibacter acidaminivorans]|uniref:ATP-dependent RecD2 DNA helicase n=1 Tax=Sedimentibacter acidaminivorans TaxID=913099 RepID=A0ABS4GEV3_9FIRM|nr:ATP-dependent RecD-like DNA helicase [Sedimentibacter acidaminivorans]MBP1926230.1 exodeoxyribonuclease V alpha subunit [Sedimentibacter acidaminivorans]
MESHKGTIVDTIFRNSENGYTVALMEIDNEVITITGFFGTDITNETIEIFGKRIKHPKYGHQFTVEMYNSVLPSSLDQIESYLSSGLIKGIGDFTAKKIVELFKEDTFNIIQNHPEKLLEIEGIGKKKVEMITKSFVEQIDIKEIMMFLQKHGISTTYGVKIYKQYGKNTINIISENPYRLTDDIYGIGFKLADKIAYSLGVEKSSPFRSASGIKYSLFEYAANGHSYVPYKLLIDSVCNLLEINIEIIENEMKNMAFQGKIHIELIEDERVVYYLPYHTAEVNVCKNLINLQNADFNIPENDILDYLYLIENESYIELTKMQKEAVIQSISNGVTVITGGPGTGKTTIIHSIIRVFEMMHKKIFLCAPTGRAAKKITESASREAKTIHRLLEYAYGEEDSNLCFNKNEDSPLDCEVLIVDEMSMVDILLMNNLLKAIKTGTRLILVGDVDQLPSVGAGNVLRDIIKSNSIKTIKLDTIFRQSLGSMIVQNAHMINNGKTPIFNKKDTDFFFMRQNNNKEVLDVIVDLYNNRLPSKYNLDPIKEIQVLSPMKKGEVGVIELNNKLQASINPPSKLKKEKAFGKYTFRVGDKVMQTKNNYQSVWSMTCDDGKVSTGEGIYNGDIGYIIFIDEIEQEIFVQFDDQKEVAYSYNQLDELILAYATTVHKSQGSEFPVIIMPIVWGPNMLLTRNLLYTAITRAKQLVVLVGFEKFIQIMIANNKINNRYSALDYRLSSIYSAYENLTDFSN